MIKKLLKAVAGLLVLVILALVVFTVYLSVTDYRPEASKDLEITVDNNDLNMVGILTPITITTFNTGYCGLDKNQDFFMDGGTMSRSSSKAKTQSNLDEITKLLAGLDNDALLLQEVDVKASRSFNIDQYSNYMLNFRGYNSTFAYNYKVPWVPVPISNPMGSVNSGLASFTRFSIASADRYQYPGGEKWPVQLFELDRCFVENKLITANGKMLILINSHLSAFDKGGEIRKKQLAFLKDYITSEYAKGNYVIVGGDWNHALPGTDPKQFKTTENWPFWLQNLPEDFTPEGFKWGVDTSTSTNRTVASAYKEGTNFESIIDGFLVSPNVIIESIAGYDLDFKNSDHNPVTGVFELIP